jgi:TRAP-type C4-dicarboxylate transport system substrate-binding protein
MRRCFMEKRIGFMFTGIICSMIVAAVLVGWSTLLPVPAAAGPIKLNYANFPPAPTFPSVQMERWADEVEKRTGGKVEVQTYPGGTLLGAKNMLDGVIAGQADIGCLVLAYQPGRFPLLSAVDLPVGFPSSLVASRTMWDLFKKYNPKELAEVKVLTLFTSPPSNIMAKDPIRTLEDLKGYELRSTGGGAPALKLLGATPVAMPMSEAPEALQKGVVKGIFSSLEILKDFKFAEFVRYETITNFQTWGFAVVMNKDRWESLPEDVQKVMDDLGVEQSEWTGKYVDNHVNEALEWSKKEYNIEVIRLSEEELAKWRKLLEPVTEKWLKDAGGAGIPGDQVLKDLMELRGKYSKMYGG